MLSGSHIFIVLLIVVILFGSSKLPHLGTALGKAISNFKKGLNDNDNEKD